MLFLKKLNFENSGEFFFFDSRFWLVNSQISIIIIVDFNFPTVW